MDLQRLGQKGIIIWYGKISISLDILFYTGLSHLAILVECLSWQFCRYCRFWSQAIGSHHLMTIFEHQNDLFSVKLIPQKISLPLCPKLSRDEMFILRQIPTTICNCPKICPQICTSELRRGSQYWKCALFLPCSGKKSLEQFGDKSGDNFRDNFFLSESGSWTTTQSTQFELLLPIFSLRWR